MEQTNKQEIKGFIGTYSHCSIGQLEAKVNKENYVYTFQHGNQTELKNRSVKVMSIMIQNGRK